LSSPPATAHIEVARNLVDLRLREREQRRERESREKKKEKRRKKKERRKEREDRIKHIKKFIQVATVTCIFTGYYNNL
jgi:hypothetical protein